MSHKNPIHEAIAKMVKPMFQSRKQSIEGTIMHMNYEKQTARVYWHDPDSGTERESPDVPFPIDGDGVFRQGAQMGDRVTLSFKNGNQMSPYITIVHTKNTKINFESKNGSAIPKGIGFL